MLRKTVVRQDGNTGAAIVHPHCRHPRRHHPDAAVTVEAVVIASVIPMRRILVRTWVGNTRVPGHLTRPLLLLLLEMRPILKVPRTQLLVIAP